MSCAKTSHTNKLTSTSVSDTSSTIWNISKAFDIAQNALLARVELSDTSLLLTLLVIHNQNTNLCRTINKTIFKTEKLLDLSEMCADLITSWNDLRNNCAMSTSYLQPAGKYATETHSKTGTLLYLSENYADFHFVFESRDGRTEKVPVHKAVLAQGSKVFDAMFSGAWKETREGTVQASASAFKKFLQIFYLATTKLTMDNVTEVMELAKMYDVSEGFAICAEFLKQNLNYDNACWVYEWAVRLGHMELTTACETLIKWNTTSVLASDNFLHCDGKTVQHILQMDSLNCSEVECFEALMNWMNAKCGRDGLSAEIVQGQFIDLIHEIRFGSMSLVEFNACDSLHDALFTEDEYSEIMKMIDCAAIEPKIFKRNRRSKFEYSWNDEICIPFQRFVHSHIPYYTKESETIRFSVGTSALFGSFWCMRLKRKSASSPTEEPIRTECTVSQMPSNSGEKVILYTGYDDLLFEDYSEICLSKPIVVQPGIVYEMQLKQSLPLRNTIYTYGGHASSKVKRKGITVHFHEDPTGNSGKGLIGGICLNKISDF